MGTKMNIRKQQGQGHRFKIKKGKFDNANDVPLGPRTGPFVGNSDAGAPSKFQNDNGKKFGKEDKQKRNNSKRKPEIEFNPKSRKSVEEKTEIERLKALLEQSSSVEPATIQSFKDLPLSKKTLQGLRDSGYEVPTEIQRESVGLALRGMDILGAAKTGSGKTLAFLIPILENLYRSLWSKADGLGAVIITPTRELAYQIFETLRKIGRHHDFSAGLIIGGKDLKFERKRMDLLNIVICTPGRLLQHMDENSSFNTSNLQVLVLDEADRCLDMGFEKDMNAILDHLPTERQTVLFSATQTKSVKDLARLSLKSPVYVSVHENSEFSTPEGLQQSYVVCPLESKLDMLWSFIKHHKSSKILVFLSSCKQVRFVNTLFCRMRPGISLLALHGAMHQLKRMAVYDEFCKKQAVVLFATDIAARGLDFPAVDWVLQLDCPEDATTYIHRAGRTARFNKDGEALLVLLPSEEEAMIQQLEQKRIPVEKIEINMKRMVSVTRKFEALLARDLNLKECAQRAFKAYLKAVFLMKNKNVFDVAVLDLPSFARSLGLAVAPRVRFLQKRGVNHNDQPDTDNESDDEETDNKDKVIQSTTAAATFDFHTADDDEDLDTLFTGKKSVEIEQDDNFTETLNTNDNPSKKPKKAKTKASVAKTLLKKKILVNQKVVFDEDGKVVPDARRDKRSEVAKSYEQEDASGVDVEKAKLILKEEDQYDKQLFRERIKARHREDRRKAKLARKGISKDMEEEEHASQIASCSESDGEGYQPDLDWLPDPDKIYGTKSDESDSDMEAAKVGGNKRQREVVNTDSESDTSEPLSKKKPTVKSTKKAKRKTKSLSISRTSEGMDASLMEDLALQLLQRNQ